MHGSFIVKWFKSVLTVQQRFTVFHLVSKLFPGSFRFVEIWVLSFFTLSIITYVLSFFIRDDLSLRRCSHYHALTVGACTLRSEGGDLH